MARLTLRKTKGRDPIELLLEDALQFGHYVDWNEGGYFVSCLEKIANDIGKLVNSDPSRAAALYQSFIAGCNEKAEEMDDSGGEFGMFPGTPGWIGSGTAHRCHHRTMRNVPTDYSLAIEYHREEDGRWLADIPALPGVTAYGRTRKQATATVQVLALRLIADRLEHGEAVAGPMELSFIAA